MRFDYITQKKEYLKVLFREIKDNLKISLQRAREYDEISNKFKDITPSQISELPKEIEELVVTYDKIIIRQGYRIIIARFRRERED